MYLLSFPRFWSLSIERVWIFLSILNGVTLKTSNSEINKQRDKFRDFYLPQSELIFILKSFYLFSSTCQSYRVLAEKHFFRSQKFTCVAAKIILSLDRFTSSDKGIAHANWIPLNKLSLKLLLLTHKCFNETVPETFQNFVKSTTAVIIYEESLIRLRHILPRQSYYLRATGCKYRPKSTFCGTSSKFEFRSFLAHR